MAPNSLSPASVEIRYHSLYAPHTATIPTKEWFPTSITGNLGSYTSWLGAPVDAEAMVVALINLLRVFVPGTTLFDSATIFTQATATSPRIPRNTKALSIAGTGSTALATAAWSSTFNFITSNFGKGKLVLLDAVQPSTWLVPVLPADFDAPVIALDAEFSNGNNAWSGRDDFPPAIISKITYDVNNKLQKAYFGN